MPALWVSCSLKLDAAFVCTCTLNWYAWLTAVVREPVAENAAVVAPCDPVKPLIGAPAAMPVTGEPWYTPTMRVGADDAVNVQVAVPAVVLVKTA